MTIVLVTVVSVIGSWVVFWSVLGMYVARRRSEPVGLAVVLAVLLGPLGVALFMLRSHRQPWPTMPPPAGDDVL